MTTAEMMEQLDIELFGYTFSARNADIYADEIEQIVDVHEYATSKLASRTGFRGDKIA